MGRPGNRTGVHIDRRNLVIATWRFEIRSLALFGQPSLGDKRSSS
jgi:hypothetical protein